MGTILNFIFKRMPLDYFAMTCLLTPIGALLGIHLQVYVKKRTGRMMYTMLMFNASIFICLIVITAFQSYVLTQKKADGHSILEGKSWC